jgi:hypothetical protein
MSRIVTVILTYHRHKPTDLRKHNVSETASASVFRSEEGDLETQTDAVSEALCFLVILDSGR